MWTSLMRSRARCAPAKVRCHCLARARSDAKPRRCHPAYRRLARHSGTDGAHPIARPAALTPADALRTQVSNFFLAFDANLEIIPILSKVDLAVADTEKCLEDVQRTFEMDPAKVLRISAKTGLNLDKVLPAVIERVPPYVATETHHIQLWQAPLLASRYPHTIYHTHAHTARSSSAPSECRSCTVLKATRRRRSRRCCSTTGTRRTRASYASSA